MANLFQSDDRIFNLQFDECKAEFDSWLADRPQCIKDLAIKYPPWILYRMKSTNQRVNVVGYNESGTVTVNVSGKFNFVVMERSVFGVSPDDLEECDLPSKDEKVGVLLTEDTDIKEYLDLYIKGDEKKTKEFIHEKISDVVFNRENN